MALEVKVLYDVHETTRTDVFRCAKVSRTMTSGGTSVTFTEGVHVEDESQRPVKAAMYAKAEVIYTYILEDSTNE